jgi:ferredoxin-thioredoxin reductase catalytic subunit
MARPRRSEQSVRKIRRYVEHYREKSGMGAHPDPGVTDAVISGLAAWGMPVTSPPGP